ncbi:MAG: haloalkane dehalogenase [Actinobacteria bacterium]|nr:haloalkane dehalogenase [Actinomycetota bacterium]
MNAVRTPDDRFTNLPGYDFSPHYVQLGDGLRMHYLDEGPADGRIVVLLHGEPSWSFLYRTMIPVLTAAGYRCIVPDLIGFGRSDKPTEQSDYTYARHIAWTSELLVDHLDVRDAIFFGQDWGSLVGLRVVTAHPDRFAAIAIGNGGLPNGDMGISDALKAWRSFAATAEEFPVGNIIDGGTVISLTPEVIAAYDAPFPDDTFKAGARIFPSLIPVSPDDVEAPNQKEAWKVLEAWDKPFLCTYSDSDPITKGADAVFIAKVPGAAGQPHVTIEGGGHFLQEDCGPQLAGVLVDWMNGLD